MIRPYFPGDDVRHIDWNVTARCSEPHVRVHVGERALTAWLVLDVSASMAFGTADRRKADVAEGVALAVGHVATRRGNRLGVLAFGAGDAARAAPAPGPARPAGAARRAARATRPSRTAGGRDVARHRAAPAWRRSAASAGCVVDRLRLPRRARLGGAAARAARAPRRAGGARSATRASRSWSPAGDLWLVDPETGRQLAGQHAPAAACASASPTAAAAERDAVAAALRARRRRPRRALHRGRLAARRSPATCAAARPRCARARRRRGGGGRPGGSHEHAQRPPRPASRPDGAGGAAYDLRASPPCSPASSLRAARGAGLRARCSGGAGARRPRGRTRRCCPNLVTAAARLAAPPAAAAAAARAGRADPRARAPAAHGRRAAARGDGDHGHRHRRAR